jgi:ATP-dependent protease ClpP protease subunit
VDKISLSYFNSISDFPKNDGETKTVEVAKTNFIHNGKIYILGEFDSSISTNIIPGISDLIGMNASEKEPNPLVIYINSHGGLASELFGLLSMLEIAKSMGIQIITYNLACAYSCGSLLAIHGNQRLMYKNAFNLMHLGSAGFESKSFEELDRNHKHTKQYFDMIVRMYVEHTKMDEEKVRHLLKDDSCFLNAKECLKYGLCDAII